MKITYLGHASLSLEIGGKHIIVDPFISPNELASSVDVESLKADYILLTHAHEDHIADVDSIVKRTGATIISNYEIVSYYGKKGYNGHPMNHGGSWNFDFGKLTYTSAIHTSSFPDGTYGGQPGGFLIQTAGKNVYIAGDTALSYDMKIIPMICSLDLAVLPIGDNFTMGIDTAVIAADFVECDRILGYHYDTFGYIEIDQQQAITSFKKKNKELILLPIGGKLVV